MPLDRSSAFLPVLAGCILALGLTMTGCATASNATSKLPFHVAIVPPVAIADTAALPQEDGNETEVAFAVDSNQLLQQMEQALGQAFCKVSRLTAPADADPDAASVALLAQAKQQGADLILRTTLSYDPKIRTALNDRFWLNLPLFALGGPFGWFVADRSYFCNCRLEGQLFDVSVALASPGKSLETTARVLRVERETKEASLNFLDRASGVGPYLLSFICPAGLIGRESDAVPAELDTAVVNQLCQAMAKALQDRATEVVESDLVAFHPRAVRVEREGGKRYLVGEMVLGLSQANELATPRSRVGTGGFVDASWDKTTVVASAGTDKGRRVYPFKIPIADSATGTMQVEIEQADRFATKRTFTFPVEEGAGR